MTKHKGPLWLAAVGALLATADAHATPVAALAIVLQPCCGPAGTSGADSVVVVGGSVYVGYSNGAA